MKKGYCILVVALFVLFGVMSAWADPVAKQILYQKKTTLSYPKTYTLKFSLWDAETAGTEVWSEEKSVSLTSSKIITYLGDSNPLNPAYFSQQLWVQVEKKKGDGTYKLIGTRDKLVPAPYALGIPTTGSVSVSAVAGIPKDSTIETYQVSIAGYIGRYQTSAPGIAEYLIVPINLPDGATITSFSYTCYDNDATYNSSAWLYNGLSGGYIATVITTGASTTPQTVTASSIDTVVDNSLYNYWVYMGIYGTAGSAITPLKAVVTYEYR